MPPTVAVIIPARFGSTRLPGKPLKMLGEMPVIAHVVVNALQTGGRVVVATDHPDIARAAEAVVHNRHPEAIRAGRFEVRMTGDFPSGTDRIAHVARDLTEDIVVNLQGDEPFLTASEIQEAVSLVAERGFDIGTIASAITDVDEYRNPNIVKVISDHAGRALIFSRFPLPYSRLSLEEADRLRQLDDGRSPFIGHRHIGLYAFRRTTLLKVAGYPPTALERAESLEQLRFMEHGHAIGVAVVNWQGVGIDTDDDLRRATHHLTTHSTGGAR